MQGWICLQCTYYVQQLHCIILRTQPCLMLHQISNLVLRLGGKIRAIAFLSHRHDEDLMLLVLPDDLLLFSWYIIKLTHGTCCLMNHIYFLTSIFIGFPNKHLTAIPGKIHSHAPSSSLPTRPHPSTYLIEEANATATTYIVVQHRR